MTPRKKASNHYGTASSAHPQANTHAQASGNSQTLTAVQIYQQLKVSLMAQAERKAAKENKRKFDKIRKRIEKIESENQRRREMLSKQAYNVPENISTRNKAAPQYIA